MGNRNLSIKIVVAVLVIAIFAALTIGLVFWTASDRSGGQVDPGASSPPAATPNIVDSQPTVLPTESAIPAETASQAPPKGDFEVDGNQDGAEIDESISKTVENRARAFFRKNEIDNGSAVIQEAASKYKFEEEGILLSQLLYDATIMQTIPYIDPKNAVRAAEEIKDPEMLVLAMLYSPQGIRPYLIVNKDSSMPLYEDSVDFVSIEAYEGIVLNSAMNTYDGVSGMYRSTVKVDGVPLYVYILEYCDGNPKLYYVEPVVPEEYKYTTLTVTQMIDMLERE